MKQVKGIVVRRRSRGTVEKIGRWWRNRYRAEVMDMDTGEVRVRELNRRFARVNEASSRTRAGELLDVLLAHEGFLDAAPGAASGARIKALDYSEKFRTEIVAGLSVNTVRKYRGVIRRLQTAMEDRWLEELDASWLRGVLVKQAEIHRKATYRTTRAVALQMIRQAARDGFRVRPIHAADVKLPVPRKPPKEKPYATEEQLAALLAGTEFPLRAMIAFGGWAGLRISEIAAVRWQDLDLTEGDETLSVRYQARGGELVPCKTTTSSATLPILHQLSSVLREYRAVWQPNEHGEHHDLLFYTRAGRAMSAGDIRDRLWHPALKRLGIRWKDKHPMGTHALRRGYPRTLLKYLSPQDTQALMRHSDLKQTTEYHQWKADDLRRSIDATGLRRAKRDDQPPKESP